MRATSDIPNRQRLLVQTGINIYPVSCIGEIDSGVAADALPDASSARREAMRDIAEERRRSARAANPFFDARLTGPYMEECTPEAKDGIAESVRALNLPQTGKALDFGCGNGVMTEAVGAHSNRDGRCAVATSAP